MMWMRKMPLNPMVVDVEFTKPFRIPATKSVWVICLEGTAWLTRDGHLADTILSPGDRAWVTRTDGAFITGMPHCRLWIGAKREQLAELRGMTQGPIRPGATEWRSPANDSSSQTFQVGWLAALRRYRLFKG